MKRWLPSRKSLQHWDMQIESEDMLEDGDKKNIDLKMIKDEIERLQGDKSKINEEIDALDSYFREQNKLLEAKEQQLFKANQQINDLISLIKDKVTLIRRLQSQIDWINSRFAYKVYRKSLMSLKKILKK